MRKYNEKYEWTHHENLLNVEDNYLDENWFCERCILTPKNDNVYIINQHLLNKFPGEMKIYRSIDRVQKKRSCI